MELDPQFAGARMRPYQVDVNWRRTTNYAAAVGDDNPHYFDDRRPGGLIAPPMLAAALTWPISSSIGDYLEFKDFPGEVLLTQVHYSERLDFHRPVRPGDRLTINGLIAGILPHRAGTHSIMRYEAIDRENRPVFTEHIGAMFRGVRCRGKGAALDLPEEPQGDWRAGPVWTQEIQIDPMLPYVYDGCTDIVFAIHTSPAFAVGVGLPGIILQGTCTLALAARELVNREARGDPARLKTLSCRFSGMVRPSTTISVELKSRVKEDLFFEVINQEGEKALSKGYARITPP
ncbi:MAG: MaoC family dehydratase N-terminal domain-containing protein [Desulfobacterales bacterium]|nr:MAG: MaoC family dehydratase N-terminal domain-containing protein [Desulfobacterales bacterium]